MPAAKKARATIRDALSVALDTRLAVLSLRAFPSRPGRAVLLGALLAACSDGAATLPTDPGSYSPVGAAGSSSASAGRGPATSGANGGQATAPSGSGGSGFGASGAHAGGSSAGPSSGGTAATGNFAGGASAGRGAAGSFGTGASGAAGNGGRGGSFGASGTSSLAGASNAGHGGATGVTGAAGSPANVPATFAAVSSIIQQNCAICHGSRAPRLTSGSTLYQTLTSTTVKECGGNALVKPNDPTNSALLMLPNWECDDIVMPQGCIDMPCLSATDLATITAWIDAGAPSK